MIVVGFDTSQPSLAATDWAAREAARRDLRLELLQAWPWGPDKPLGTGQAERWARQQLAERAEAVRAAHPGLVVVATHVEDDAVDVLTAATDRAALLVLGSRGLGPVHGFLVGSVSQRVLGRAGCPVVLVRAPSGPAGEGVIMGIDLAHPCREVLAFAFETAASRGAPLTVVHAWRPPAGSEYLHFDAGGDLDPELAQAELRGLEEAVAPWRERYPDLPCATALLRGHAALTVVEAAAGAELLVVGARPRHHALGAHLGPVTHAVVHHVGCPVAVVPYDPARAAD
ncbi:universal stress protein [Kitasatospora sp. NPDC058965]|uniref:universal stress protein n=1 Tax=Kitasatospora sp. NPDC058965 TaxID=3346682 RepID=UPI00368D1E52